MDGEGGDLEIDSELVMSFYDQCHDLGKVVGLGKNDPGDMIELKSVTPQMWNLPDLLVGLDGRSDKSNNHSPTTIPTPPQDIYPTRSTSLNTDPKHSFLFETFRQQTDSLLEGLGILGPPSLQTIKTETCITPPPTIQEYNGLEGLELEMAPFELNLTPKTEPQDIDLNIAQPRLVHNIHHLSSELVTTPQGILTRGELVTTPQGILTTHHGMDIVQPIVTTQGIVTTHQILNVSLPPQYRTVQGLQVHNSDLSDAVAVATHDNFTLIPSDTHHMSDVTLDMLQDEEDMGGCGGVDPLDANPSYKRCHLCVRIFSTKANLSSHIRHVHLGEAKHSRVKSIPCPHCQKMFSRKGHMTEHVRTVHEGKKRIYKEVNCQHCGKTFRRKWGLNIHISSAHADVVSTLVRQ